MNPKEVVENIEASFAMENMELTKEDVLRVDAIISHRKTVDEVIAELDAKYGYIRQNV